MWLTTFPEGQLDCIFTMLNKQQRFQQYLSWSKETTFVIPDPSVLHHWEEEVLFPSAQSQWDRWIEGHSVWRNTETIMSCSFTLQLWNLVWNIEPFSRKQPYGSCINHTPSWNTFMVALAKASKILNLLMRDIL